MKPRGIENILLRRVRRHQSMTALFRAPSSERPPQLQARPVVQQQEQDSLVDIPTTEVSPSLPVTPARPGTVARQVIPPSTSAPQPLSPVPSATAATEPAKTPDPVWKRLQTIFRKHQEQDDPSEEDTTDLKADTAEPIQRQILEEKEAPQQTSAEEHVLPTRSQETTIPATRNVQRSPENAESKSEPASMDVPHKVQTLSSTSPEIKKPEAARSVEFKPALPDQKPEVNDQGSIARESGGPSLPLESVWNVQRVETSHPLFQEDIPHPLSDRTEEDRNKAPGETSPVHEPKPASGPIQLRREDDSSTETQISDALPFSEQREESREPVEILPPSRPRPPQMDRPSNSVNIQRQSQEHSAPQEINETPPVNTVIGPLPADLWWLLGQKPPAAAPAAQPEIQRSLEGAPKQIPPEQSHNAPPHTPMEHPVETSITPNTIQRQPLSKEPLASSQQEPVRSARDKETEHAKPDLDDLARRVYAEVRRRLAAEWERRR